MPRDVGSPDILTLSGLLTDRAAQCAEADALVFPETRRSYGELHEKARFWAKVFIGLGVAPRQHVGLLLHTCPEFVEALFGAALAGAVVAPINARYVGGELRYVTENADLKAVVTTAGIADSVDFVARLADAFPDLPQAEDPRRLSLSGAPELNAVALLGGDANGFVAEAALADIAAGVSDAEVDARAAGVRPEDIALILYTSGTTSNPKGCLIPHRGIVGNSRALGRDRYEMTAEDRFWSPLPIFHIAGILPMVAVLDVGGAYLTIPRFEAGMALEMLEAERATVTFPCFVTIMQDLINHPRFAETDLSRVRLMNSNLAVQPGAIKEAIAKAMPDAVQVGTYGLTEASGTVCTSRLTDTYDQRTGRLGVPLAGWEVRIANPETGEPCATDEHGEILIRGPGQLAGYYKSPEKTAETIDADGWVHTGDIGSLNADGQIMFHGRTKDMLKVGGENVAAAEIEAVLNTHPAVELAQVVGAPDPRYVEVPAAFVKLKAGAAANEQELIEHCRGSFASFKIPRYVRFVDDWPMSTSKIQKFKLKDLIEAELGAQASA